ncbi:flavin reductase [Streptomyces varsoviensis]|uniref:Flavin reductase n=2 Tax=Streptomyces varsoviensis TaxID=67373 RepID=A0ABR5JCC1_9ACTN|nr:flavin reductase [Streptomyces varsoviensis]
MAAEGVDPQEFRSVMGHFCSGITVVTAFGPDGPVGFTCQSFSSLSLRPPRVLLCPSRSSTTWPVISAAGRFCVNVLAAGQEGLSNGFARSGGDKFADVEWDLSPDGMPLLSGVAAWVDCELQAEYDGGDHLVVTADVHGLGVGGAAGPLLYYRGKYARITPPLPV